MTQQTAGASEQTPLLGDRDAALEAAPALAAAPDTTTEEVQRPSKATIWAVLPTLLLGVFIAQADSSIVLATSQEIASEFRVLSDASWLVTSYSLAQCACQPLYGKLSDIFGRKASLVFAYGVFAVGCAMCSAGSSYWHVLAGRAVSGIGGAGMVGMVSIVIADMFPVREVATWRSYVNVVATAGRSCGGPSGGWLVDNIGWRWCFLGQCPFAALALLLVIMCLPDTGRHHAVDKEEETMREKVSRVDFAGLVTLPAMLITFFVGLDLAGKLAPWYYIVPVLGLAVVLAVVFYCIEKYRAKEPILPLDLLKKRDVVTSYGMIGLQTAGQFTLLYTIPMYFQVVTGMSVAAAGSRLVLVVIGNTVGGLASGYIIKRTSRYKGLMITAVSLACTCYLLILLRWRTGSTAWYDTMWVILGGLGMGITQSTTFVHLAASLDRSEMAIAGTSWFLAQSVGLLVSANLFNMVHNISLKDLLAKRLDGTKDEDKIIEGALSSVEYIWTLPEKLRKIVTQSYVDSLGYTNGMALAFGVCSAFFAFAMKEHPLKG